MVPLAFKALRSLPVPDHSQRFWVVPANLPATAKQFRVDTLGCWSMTELLTQGVMTDVDHPGPKGTLGRAAPEYEIQIRKDDGSLAATGEKGVLHIHGVRGVSIFKEYYKNPEANEKAFDENGWFDTGDVFRIDENGWLFFSDREKDMLKVGGENVASKEIESVIMQTGLAKECAVVAQKHYMLDAVPVVFVIPTVAGADLDEKIFSQEIIRHCRENLADFKVVRGVHRVEELPRSANEKVAKNELRDRLPAIKSEYEAMELDCNRIDTELLP